MITPHVARVAALAVATALLSTAASAQTRSAGPIIENYGTVFAVPDPGLATPLDTPLKIRFDVSTGTEKPDQVNAAIDSAARFLNMHAQAGVPAANLSVGVVLHGGAAVSALSNEAYRKRFGVDNPNLALIEALAKAGTRIYLCGQSAASRGITRGDVATPVKVALSAMTAHLVLASEGYVLNP
ncbi:MAG: DsrE family protein [Vicinamibacterales bacterium]